MGANSKIGAARISSMVSASVIIVVGGFTVAYVALVGAFFPLIGTASRFFGSANVLMYVTIEILFLIIVLYATYACLRPKK